MQGPFYDDALAVAAPDCIFPELSGVDVVKTCVIKTDVDPCPWIGKFLGLFETAQRGMEVVRSVTLLHTRFHNASHLRHRVDPLGRPYRTDVAAPPSAFLKEWALRWVKTDRSTITESPTAELFVFENVKSAMKLEVSTWTVHQVYGRGHSALHYAFLLKADDM
ncbi:hypothetical protein AAVH_41856 [Aphelenchoides avenae]|nr:hypothetical protein AAVH_41856 [Aphelenchus avenae]